MSTQKRLELKLNQPKGRLLLMPLVLLLACQSPSTHTTSNSSPELVDKQATPETVALYQNLKEVAQTQVLYGHQDDLAYGSEWWAEPGRSDVKETTGSYPAVYGWDIGDIVQKNVEVNLDGVNFEQMKNWIKEGYERGGLITISWHMNHPVTGGNSWDKTPGVSAVLPGAEQHEEFKSWLDIFAQFAKDLKGSKGEAIPVIFRPYHEHNGNWFWWGKGIASEEEYMALWKFTVDYLRDEKAVHNLLYAFSPDRSRLDINKFKEDYFYGYPGDKYVDIIGLDNYWDVGHPANNATEQEKQESLVKSLTHLVQIADSLGKIAALTETGAEGVPDEKWWTEVLGAGINANEYTRRIAWVLTWRNANTERFGQGDHFFASPPGHKSAPDMKAFRDMELFLFEGELPNMYERVQN